MEEWWGSTKNEPEHPLGSSEKVQKRATLRPGGIRAGVQGGRSTEWQRKGGGHKKLYRPVDHPQASIAHIYSQRAYRELRMLKFMKQHPHINVIGLVDAFTPSETIENFRDIYLVTQLVDTDLSSLIRNDLLRHLPQRDTVIQYIAYQILCGLKHIHSAEIIHRYACKKHIQIKQENSSRRLVSGI